MHPQFTPAVLGRFWAKVNRDGPVPPHCSELGPCWVWTGATKQGDYGKFSLPLRGPLRRRLTLAHHIAWMLAHGPIPPGLWVLHRCDNPPCVRPEHLFLGDHRANMRDMWAKGRGAVQPIPRPVPEQMARGERVNTAKLTPTLVVEIRRAYAAGEGSYSELGARYGMNRNSIYNLVHRVTWRHIA